MTLAVVETTPVTKKKGREPRGMSREQMDAQWPSLKTLAGPPTRVGNQAWIAAFTLHPDAMVMLLADIIKQHHATPGRIGQRPMPKEEEVDLGVILGGEVTDLPIHEVLPKIVKISERAFCRKVLMSRTQYQRLLSGDYQPTLDEVRRIAVAAHKPAAYFAEYRIMAVQAALINLLAERPGIATNLYRNYLQIRSAPKARR